MGISSKIVWCDDIARRGGFFEPACDATSQSRQLTKPESGANDDGNRASIAGVGANRGGCTHHIRLTPPAQHNTPDPHQLTRVWSNISASLTCAGARGLGNLNDAAIHPGCTCGQCVLHLQLLLFAADPTTRSICCAEIFVQTERASTTGRPAICGVGICQKHFFG